MWICASEPQFFAMTAQIMRRILVDVARTRRTISRRAIGITLYFTSIPVPFATRHVSRCRNSPARITAGTSHCGAITRPNGAQNLCVILRSNRHCRAERLRATRRSLRFYNSRLAGVEEDGVR